MAANKLVAFVYLIFLNIVLYANEMEFIIKHLQQYRRPFTVVEITNKPYDQTMSSQLAIQFPNATFVLWGGAYFSESKPPMYQNFILLARPITSKILQRVSEVENVELVIVSDFSWQPVLKQDVDSITRLGSYILFSHAIIEQESIGKAIRDHLIKKFSFSNDLPEESIFIYVGEKTIIRNHCLELSHAELGNTKIFKLVENFDQKYLLKTKLDQKITVKSDWKAGINLVTFKVCQGTYPSPEVIKKGIEKLRTVPHLDWAPNNMVIQGNNIVVIDITQPPGTTQL
jgi:hypothetical protein